MLLLSKATAKTIDVVYTPAASPGTAASNNPSACAAANMAKVSVIVIN
jgi:hypothetical protein